MDYLLPDINNLPLELMLLLDMVNLLFKSTVHHLHLLLLLGAQEVQLDPGALPVSRVRRGQGLGTGLEGQDLGTGLEVPVAGRDLLSPPLEVVVWPRVPDQWRWCGQEAAIRGEL